jgi:hypothetical protein
MHRAQYQSLYYYYHFLSLLLKVFLDFLNSINFIIIIIMLWNILIKFFEINIFFEIYDFDLLYLACDRSIFILIIRLYPNHYYFNLKHLIFQFLKFIDHSVIILLKCKILFYYPN